MFSAVTSQCLPMSLGVSESGSCNNAKPWPYRPQGSLDEGVLTCAGDHEVLSSIDLSEGPFWCFHVNVKRLP